MRQSALLQTHHTNSSIAAFSSHESSDIRATQPVTLRHVHNSDKEPLPPSQLFQQVPILPDTACVSKDSVAVCNLTFEKQKLQQRQFALYPHLPKTDTKLHTTRVHSVFSVLCSISTDSHKSNFKKGTSSNFSFKFHSSRHHPRHRLNLFSRLLHRHQLFSRIRRKQKDFRHNSFRQRYSKFFSFLLLFGIMLSASHIGLGRSRSRQRTGSRQRSASQDCARQPECASGAMFKFLTETARSQYGDFGETYDDEDDDAVESDNESSEISETSKQTSKLSLEEPASSSPNVLLRDPFSETDSPVPESSPSGSAMLSKLAQSIQSVVAQNPTIQAGNVHDPSSLPLDNPRVAYITDTLRNHLGAGEDDILLADYPCWLLKNILLEGKLYITNKEVCFLAYLPVKKTSVIMSGNLSKKAKKSSRYTRYWFVLRNDMFAYYTSATDLYFPSGTVDLRYAIQAEILPGPDGHKASSAVFSLITEKRTYTFKADTHSSAQHWVKALQKEIFRSRNEGDQVKIKIPVKNIIDLEESVLFDIVDALKIRAIDSDETFAIDEYVLAFLPGAKGFEVPAGAIRRSMERQGVSEVTDFDIAQLSESRKLLGRISDSTHLRAPTGESPPGTPLRSPSPSLSPGRISSLGRKVSKRFSTLVTSPKEVLFSRPTSPAPPSPGSQDSFIDVSEKYQELNNVNDGDAELEAKKKKPGAATTVVNKVTEMWMGGAKHFESHNSNDDKFLVSQEDRNESNERFRSHFSLGDSEELVASYYAHIQKAIPIYGKIYVSHNYVCFRSLFPGTRTQMILPVRDIENVSKERGFRFGYSGLVIVIHGHEEIFFEFGLGLNRDDCVNVILKQLDLQHQRKNSLAPSINRDELELRHARLFTYEDALCGDQGVDALCDGGVLETTFATDTPGAKALKPLKFTLLTIGSRGDVQPYIALAKGLMKEGHSVKIASHSEFREWVEGYGIEYAEIAGDPGELMKIMIEHGMFSVSFLRDAAARFRSWIDDLLVSAWEACQGTDVLIESPSAMAGIHIAEALKIPYFRAFTMPWTRTRAYPHAFIVPEQKMGGSYNYLTYVLFDNVFWKGISGQVNKWRKDHLGLSKTNLELMQQNKVPFFYSVSPAVLVPPVDFSDWIKVTGYWFLDEGKDDFKPPEDLVNFISKARKDNKKIVYIGFGSIVVSNSQELTKAVVDSVLKADVRCILSKGWSDRYGSEDASVPEVTLPPEIFQIKSAPHDWLFPQMDAAVHHGGSGTTGASLRAGVPTIIKPFFGDQFFYAGRVEDLGAGIFLKKLNVTQLSKALLEATSNEKMIAKAGAIGKQIQSENGVSRTIEALYKEMRYAKSLIKNSNSNISTPESGRIGKESSTPDSPSLGDDGQKTDDSWMLVESQGTKEDFEM